MIGFFARKRSVSFATLGPEHIHQCASLHAAAFASGWSESDLEALIADRAVAGECALDGPGGPVLGFAISRFALDEAEVLTVVVGSRFRRKGIGRALVQNHVLNLNNLGVRSIFLEVGDDNVAARRLYGRLGFRQIGERTGYYRDSRGARSAKTMKLVVP